MRRLILILLGIVVFLPFTAHAKSWQYSSWEVVADVHDDASVAITETVTYDFSGDFSWVTRDLPKSKGILYRDVSVLDEKGNVLTGDAVDIDNKQTSARIQVNFSALDEQRTWTFRYTVDNAIGYFADYDEFYWNAVSIDRDVPIDSVSVTVTLPSTIAASDIRQRLFFGPIGSTIESYEYTVAADGVLQYSGASIGERESFTVVAGWPKGVVTETYVKPTRIPLQTFAYVLLFPIGVSPFLLFVLLYRRWQKHGRDPKGRGTIVPQYEPPDKTQPAVMSVLLYERAENKNLAVTIVDLAVRGYLVIEENHEGLFHKKSYAFEKRKDWTGDGSLLPFERELLEHFFDEGDRVQMRDLKDSFYKNVPGLKQGMVDAAVAQGYFENKPGSAGVLQYVYGSGWLIAGVILAFVANDVLDFGTNPWLVLFFPVFVVNAILFFVFGKIMPKRSAKGVAAREWAEGFKRYLHTAERFRIAAMKPETFERFLPYAMVFGVEKEWAEKFADMYKEPPSWYVRSNIGTFQLVAFTSGFSHAMNTSVASALASSPSSSSGFGSGGFSGGGGGGGGGGAG